MNLIRGTEVYDEDDDRLEGSIMTPHIKRSEVKNIIKDAEERKNQKEELILIMESKKYKFSCLKMRPRTLLNKMNISNKLIRDDSVQIKLR
jgi:hypothetical protein